MGQLNPLFEYSRKHPKLKPHTALERYIVEAPADPENQQLLRSASNAFGLSSPANNQIGLLDGGNPNGIVAHGNLVVQNSPAGGSMQATGMSLQQSQQGSSSGVSTNTSPNVNNKRRRPSLKEEEGTQVNGTGTPNQAAGANAGNKIKPSPRIGGKRQKGGPP